MWLTTGVHILNTAATVAARVAAGLAAAVLTAMMFLTGADVVLRYAFGRPVPGALELTEFMMVIVISFGLAYCALKKRHVRIELVIFRLPERAQAAMNGIADMAFLVLFAVIAWRSLFRVQSMLEGQLTSAVLFIPTFPFMILVMVGCIILCLVLLKDLMDGLSRVVKK